MSPSAFHLIWCSLITAVAAKDLHFGEATPGRPGGRLVIAQRAEPKTLNPIFGLDVISGELTSLLTADLIHLNRGKAAPLRAHVSAGNKAWVNRDISKPPRSLDRARQLLREAGFSWNKEGRLIDPSRNEVAFSIITSAGNAQRGQIGTIIQDDLKQWGMKVSIVALEFRAMLDRVFRSDEYEAAVMTLASGDTDPNSDMNVWTVKGSTHLWNLNGGRAENWKLEIDSLMREQMTTLNPELRKGLCDRVQFLVATRLPIASLLSTHVLVGASERLGNFRPSILRPYALWNADELYFREGLGPVR